MTRSRALAHSRRPHASRLGGQTSYCHTLVLIRDLQLIARRVYALKKRLLSTDYSHDLQSKPSDLLPPYMDEEIVQTSDPDETELENASNALEYWKKTSSAICASYASLHRQYQAVRKRQELEKHRAPPKASSPRRSLPQNDIEYSPIKRIKVCAFHQDSMFITN